MARGNFNKAVGRASARQQLGVPTLHLHDLRHTGNTLAAMAGSSLRDPMTRIGHDSPAAALIYQHSNRASDEAIAAALDAQLAAYEREACNVPGVRLGPEAGPVPAGDAA